MEPRSLSNPPIIEAMIEIGVEAPEGGDAQRWDQVLAGVEGDFPTRRDSWEIQMAWSIPPGSGGEATTVPAPPRAVGRLCFSADEHRAIQIWARRFAFSHLKVYSGWETLREEAKVLWARYLRTLAPTRVRSVAVRYINRLELPLVGAETSDFLLLAPVIPEGLPGMTNSLLKVTLLDAPSGAVANVIEAVDPAPQSDAFYVNLDIEARLDVDLDPDDVGLWDRLESLRAFKNKIFFASLTERALEPYR